MEIKERRNLYEKYKSTALSRSCSVPEVCNSPALYSGFIKQNRSKISKKITKIFV